jgi:hypothetical protein
VTTDRFIPRVVVVGLALSVLFGMALMGYLASTQTPIPDSFDRLVFLLAGGFVGILASTKSGDKEPVDVVVANKKDDAVPTTDVKAKK